VIPAAELENFRLDLAGTLELYQGTIAIEMSPTSYRGFADVLDTKRKLYNTALRGDSTRPQSQEKREAVAHLISQIGTLARLVRELAHLVESYRRPTKPGELAGSSDDLTALGERYTQVLELMENLIGTVDQTKRILRRRRRSGFNGEPRDEGNRPYRHEPIVAVREYRRLPKRGAGASGRARSAA